MINKGCDCFRCPEWYCRDITSEDRLGFGSCFTRSTLEWHCQLWKTGETTCRVNDYTVVSHEVQTSNWPCKIHDYGKSLAKVLSATSKLSMAVANCFPNWLLPLVYEN